jgi:hypothetical protein
MFGPRRPTECRLVTAVRSGAHHPDPAVAGVGDHQVARAVNHDPGRMIQFRRGGRAGVAGEPGGPVAGGPAVSVSSDVSPSIPVKARRSKTQMTV